VALPREIERQIRAVAQTIAAHVPAVLEGGAVAGRGESGERGHRAAADEQAHGALGVGGEADELHQPAYGAALQIDRGVVAPGAAGVHGGGQQFGQDAHGRGGRVDPAEEARVAVAHGVRQDLPREGVQDSLRRQASLGEGLLQHGAPLIGRHGAEDGFCGDASQVRGGEVDGPVAQPAELLGVERQGHPHPPVRRLIAAFFCCIEHAHG